MMKCDKCGSEDTYKLSQIYAASTLVVGTDTSNSGIGVTSSGNLGVGVGGSSTSGKIQSLRGLSSAPPEEPSNARLGCSIYFVYFIMCFIVLCVIEEGSEETLSEYTKGFHAFITLLMCILGGIAIFIWASNRTKQQLKQYKTEFDTWNKKWACNRCGNVFIPE